MSFLIALLGHTQKPTCGVEDYCTFLSRTLRELGSRLEVVPMQWAERGWIAACRNLWRESAAWHGQWAIVQYTAGAWSRYGLPIGALVVVAILRARRVRTAVMFHEPYSWEVPPVNLLDRIRAACQDWVIRMLYHFSSEAIFADPLETIAWLPVHKKKGVFIPIGGNIPEPDFSSADSNFRARGRKDARKTVAVFCVSDPPRRRNELEEIGHALRVASSHGVRLRLVLVGRGTAEAREEVEEIVAGMDVEMQICGIQSAEEVSRILAASDAMLCVRGRLFPRRGSALAGITCGVPIIAYEGPAQQTPLVETGIEFVRYRDKNALGAVLTRVLNDENLQAELRAKSRRGQEDYFSWKRIASLHLHALGLPVLNTAESQLKSTAELGYVK